MRVIWGSVNSQYWSDGLAQLFTEDGCQTDAASGFWQSVEVRGNGPDGDLNLVQAMYVAFRCDYLTSGPNWRNNTAQGDVTIWLHNDCGYENAVGVCFYHTREQEDESHLDLFLRCIAQDMEQPVEVVRQALQENNWFDSFDSKEVRTFDQSLSGKA